MNSPIFGKFITIEGIEGVGKSTNVDFIRQWLKNQGIEVICTREPGGTLLAEKIRAIVLDAATSQIDPISELLLIFASRKQHLVEVIMPALQAGKWVVCDRFTDSSYAYQGYGRDMGISIIEKLATVAQADFQPDKTILLDAPYEVSSERLDKRNNPTDRFEAENRLFFEKVRAGFLALAQNQPERVAVIDASKELKKVQAAIAKILQKVLESTK